MLSPQKAPERLMQLADSNLESLVIEMDQLHSRVHTIHFLKKISAIFCHLLSFYPAVTLFLPNISWRKKRLSNRMRSDYVWSMRLWLCLKDCKCSCLLSCFHWDGTGKGYTNYSFNNNNKTVSKWAAQERWTVWIHTQKSIVSIIVGIRLPLLFSSSHPAFVPTPRGLRYRHES